MICVFDTLEQLCRNSGKPVPKYAPAAEPGDPRPARAPRYTIIQEIQHVVSVTTGYFLFVQPQVSLASVALRGKPAQQLHDFILSVCHIFSLCMTLLLSLRQCFVTGTVCRHVHTNLFTTTFLPFLHHTQLFPS